MQPHQERVVAEKKELDEKIDKLKAFIVESPTYVGLPAHERNMLLQQYDAMTLYSNILGIRIIAFQESPV